MLFSERLAPPELQPRLGYAFRRILTGLALVGFLSGCVLLALQAGLKWGRDGRILFGLTSGERCC